MSVTIRLSYTLDFATPPFWQGLGPTAWSHANMITHTRVGVKGRHQGKFLYGSRLLS